MNSLADLPGVDKLLKNKELRRYLEEYGHDLTVYSIRKVLNTVRKNYKKTKVVPELSEIVEKIKDKIDGIFKKNLIPIINGTGIIIHTNLGRSVLGKKVFDELKPILTEYSNLEYNLEKMKRGHRDDHLMEPLKFITGSEDVLVLNNNAAAVFMILKTFAEGKEVIISRGELVEIGGSFRIPDIMAQSGAKMVEVGATNKTHLADYENAINENTAMIFKAHKSNYFIGGFTEEVDLKALSDLAHKNNLLFYYDLGSGLLKQSKILKNHLEPDVKSSLNFGCDLLSFSGDKLLGGPQAGIVCGKASLIEKLNKHPLKRAFRVDKVTIAILISVIKSYLSEQNLINRNPTFQKMNLNKNDLRIKAEQFLQTLESLKIKAEIVESYGRCGGGTLPKVEINSFSIKISKNFLFNKNISPEKLFQQLHKCQKPIISVLKEKNIFFDVLTLNQSDFSYIADEINKIIN
jgi:L-seryl-tRNA(Ser) seleniumtransferase